MHSTKLTWADLEALPADGRRHELIDGEHFVTPSPRVRHQRIVAQLFRVLDPLVTAAGLGEVFLSPLDVVLSDHDVVEPDLLVVRRERFGILGEVVHGAPDLAIEVLSPGSRRLDEVLKRDVYERYGVRELWIVDPEAEAVKVYRRTGEGFARAELLEAREGDVLRSDLVPGLALPLAELFAVVA